MYLPSALLTLFASSALAAPTQLGSRGDPYPTVVLDNATVIGKANGSVVQFLGLPYAQPPYVLIVALMPPPP